jgi:antagonist of KipI
MEGSAMSLTIIKSAPLTTIQDLGRPGYQRYGVVVGGAADSFSARVANALVGNAPNAALLEVALVGPLMRFGAEALIAWCGAEFDMRLGNIPLPPNRPVRLPAGATVSFGAVRAGARAWLAIAGGIDVPLLLGSRSTSRRFGMGGLKGRVLIAGDQLEFGAPSDWAKRISSSLRATGSVHCDWSVRPSSLCQSSTSGKLRAMRGPEWDWFSAEAQMQFFASSYRVTKDADRMGVRLDGPALELKEPREMISSAVDEGIVQVPPGAQPIVLLCSRQTVGGYPRLAAVAAVDHGRLAQLKQGDLMAFEEVGLRQAHKLYLAREQNFNRVSEELSRRTG